MSQGLARSLTFIVNGIFHDIIASIIFGSLFFGVTLLFITYIFILKIEETLEISISKMEIRILYNLTLLSVPFLLLMHFLN